MRVSLILTAAAGLLGVWCVKAAVSTPGPSQHSVFHKYDSPRDYGKEKQDPQDKFHHEPRMDNHLNHIVPQGPSHGSAHRELTNERNVYHVVLSGVAAKFGPSLV